MRPVAALRVFECVPWAGSRAEAGSYLRLIYFCISGQAREEAVSPCSWVRCFLAYRGTSVIRNSAPLEDPTVGKCLGPYGGPKGGGCFLGARYPYLHPSVHALKPSL